MFAQLTKRLELFSDSNNLQLLTLLQRGIEKESLRVTPHGELAQTPHPQGLGAALTHPHITTDFSEALMELITPVSTSIEGTLDFLGNVHRYVYTQLGDEQLWTTSMPCILSDDTHIPVAKYGSSNVAQMKTIYRLGLGNRYGRAMQTIAGIHYNFSLPKQLWPLLQQQDNNTSPEQDYITDAYFKLIRNFRRASWLLVYLFGASPALSKSFLNNQPHKLSTLGDHTLYLPYGTALRMGNLGYQSEAQDNLEICYNRLENYIETLHSAITRSHEGYEKIGSKTPDGNYQQLSTALLQIENEFYSPIRPKRVTASGETPLGALSDRGIEYIEVRCIDVNPYLPLGIDAEQVRFIDSFLLFCLFDDSPLCDDLDQLRIDNNLQKVVNYGRKPGLTLEQRTGPIDLVTWGTQLLDGIEQVAKQLDLAHGGDSYYQASQKQRAKLNNPDLTPSAQTLTDIKERDQTFTDFAMRLTQEHSQGFLAQALSEEEEQQQQHIAAHSTARQTEIETADKLTFDQYLDHYYQQYQALDQ